jgi:hypothetical protein
VGRIRLGDPGQREVAGHPVANLPRGEGGNALAHHAAGEDIRCRGGLELLPLSQGFRDIGRQIHHPIHVAFTVLNPNGALGQVEGGPEKTAHFTHAEAAAQHEQKHRAVAQGIDDPKERDDLVLRHGAGEFLGHEDVMAGQSNRRLRDIALVA